METYRHAGYSLLVSVLYDVSNNQWAQIYHYYYDHKIKQLTVLCIVT